MSQPVERRTWWKTALMGAGIMLLLAAVLSGVSALAYFAAWFPAWTGFSQPPLNAQGAVVPQAKTLWDWLELLLVPGVLAVGGFLLTRAENRYAQRLQDQREQAAQRREMERYREQRRIEEERTQDGLIREYLAAMTGLLEKRLRQSEDGDELRSIARAQTLTVLDRIDGQRKRTVLTFLYEARLIGYLDDDEALVPPIVALTGANLELAALNGARLPGANLTRVRLAGANLSHANLTRAQLQQADLHGANLHTVRMSGANASDAQFEGADLTDALLRDAALVRTNFARAQATRALMWRARPRWAIFTSAVLKGAVFEDADLERATFAQADLTEADLSRTKLKDADFSEATLTGANFHSADTRDINLTGAVLTAATITTAQIAYVASTAGAMLPDTVTPID